MKRFCLFVVVLAPTVAIAQQTFLSGTSAALNTASLTALEPLVEAGDAADAASGPPASPSSGGQQSGTTAGQAKKKPRSSDVNVPRPTVGSSMVGYIENAVVGTEFRTRFDMAFNDQFPDRSEFIYAKCGCYRGLPTTNAAYDPNAPGPGPGIPNNVNFQTWSFMGEYAPKHNAHFSMFVEVPFRWLQPQGLVAGPPGATVAFLNGAGISDVTAGLKYALIANKTTYLTAQFKSYFPSGSALHGLGTHHYSVEPALLYYQRFSDKFELEGEIGGWLPTSGSAGNPTNGGGSFSGNIFFYGIGPSYRVIDHENFKLAPVIELVGWSVTGGQQTGTTNPSASGTNIVNMKFGARMTFAEKNSVYVGYGIALTSADWYNDIVRIEYRRSF